MFRISEDPGQQAFRILQATFVIAPIIAGLDKFINFMTLWSHYLSPTLYRLVGTHAQGFMMIVGLIEIAAGIGMIFKPKLFANIVAAWLLLIIINLLMGQFFDEAFRDLGLMLSVFALSRLSLKYAI